MRMSRRHGRYLVIGASGILAPLGSLLRADGLCTTGVSRGSRLSVGVWDEHVALDTQDLPAIRLWVAKRQVAVAGLVAYSPAVAASAWVLLRPLTERLAVVATTEWAAPGAAEPPWHEFADVVVQLGWAVDDRGSRWHTAEEVSAAVASTLRAEQVTGLCGAVRPWSDRPR